MSKSAAQLLYAPVLVCSYLLIALNVTVERHIESNASQEVEIFGYAKKTDLFSLGFTLLF